MLNQITVGLKTRVSVSYLAIWDIWVCQGIGHKDVEEAESIFVVIPTSIQTVRPVCAKDIFFNHRCNILHLLSRAAARKSLFPLISQRIVLLATSKMQPDILRLEITLSTKITKNTPTVETKLFTSTLSVSSLIRLNIWNTFKVQICCGPMLLEE